MAKTMEEHFLADLKKTVRDRLNYYNYTLSDIPRPSFQNDVGILGYKNIFAVVNKKGCVLASVLKLPGRDFTKKLYLPNGKPFLDMKGNHKTEKIKIEADNVLCASASSITVVNSKNYLGKRKTKLGLLYFYSFPKRILYRSYFTALYISTSKIQNYFSGQQVILTTGNKIYIQVAPFKASDVYKDKQTLTRQLVCIKRGFNYDDEIQTIINFWLNTGIIFHPGFFIDSESFNYVFGALEPTLDIGDHNVYSPVPLSEEKVSTTEEVEG
jgi:hypothetical protein